jgi:hypothetical protein
MNGQLLWFVAFILYVYDSVSLRQRHAVLRYSLGRITAVLMMPTLSIAGHSIFIPNPLRPDECDLILSSVNRTGLTPLDRYFIGRALRLYLVHQIVAIGSLLTLFVLTPILTTRMNLLYACVISVAATYWLCLFHWIEMWRSRRLLGISTKTVWFDIAHILLCPPNAVNCARRIAALRQPSYGILPTLRAFSHYDAEKYEEQVLSV